ncbi:thiamine diphosphokinase [Niallia sp. Krafla_26]|uniref:thiamine diphosphokinase n=1 Tax=Niallia sp. Krafla_26 TaxID=3064703 RepID=UPI003D1790CB
MIIHILAGGPIDLLPHLETYHNDQVIWVGVDRGVYTLLSKKIIPKMAFGDFDSVSEEELQEIEKKVERIVRHVPEKDETDMELALSWALNQEPEKIRIFGATGGRLDHMFGNIQLLIQAIQSKFFKDIEIIDRQNIIFVKKPGAYAIEKLDEKKYVSFIPISHEVRGLTLKGFKYPLTNRHIEVGSTLCISNEILNDFGTFSFSNGILMIIRSSD